jgi:hypothetical protein
LPHLGQFVLDDHISTLGGIVLIGESVIPFFLPSQWPARMSKQDEPYRKGEGTHLAMAAMDASAAIAHMDAVSIPLLVRLHTELKNLEEFSAQWKHRVLSISRLLDYAMEKYGDLLFIRMIVKFKDEFGTNPLLGSGHIKRMMGLGVVVSKVRKIYTRDELGPSP